MNPEDTTTRDKVLKTTVRLLAKSEPAKLTIRQIAAEAGVNVAAINYHFRSKENLIDEAVFMFSQDAFSAGLRMLTDPSLTPEARLARFFKGYAYGLVEFRGATETAFLGIMNATAGQGKYAGMMQEMFQATRKNVGELTGERDEKEQSRAALMLISGVVFPFLFADLFRASSGIDYRDQPERDRYIDVLIRALKKGKE
jgi:AcrR family transcriptional regulator